MSKITVSETVSRSIAVDNSIADVQTAITRCFQFLEERRFNEASVIIEQVLNIDPNNTDAHVANFLCHFKLTCVNEVADKSQYIDEYLNSVFYKRIVNGTQTDLSQRLNSRLNISKSQIDILKTQTCIANLKSIKILSCFIGLSVFALYLVYAWLLTPFHKNTLVRVTLIFLLAFSFISLALWSYYKHKIPNELH